MAELTIFTEKPIGEAKFAGVLAVVPSAVGGEELVSAGGLRPRGAPVRAQAPVENVVKSAHYGTENVLKWTKEVAEKLCVGRAEANSQKDWIGQASIKKKIQKEKSKSFSLHKFEYVRLSLESTSLESTIFTS